MRENQAFSLTARRRQGAVAALDRPSEEFAAKPRSCSRHPDWAARQKLLVSPRPFPLAPSLLRCAFRHWCVVLLLSLVPIQAATPVPVPGWRLDLVAQAPAIQHPSAIACAPDGRVFVAEDPMDIRTERADVAEGRILCFHPDGRRTVFAEPVYAVFGLQYLDGRLYALHNPFFSVWEDAGDQGTHRVDLVRNTNPNWHALGWNDHVPAGFRLGLDGRFYVATGDKGLFGAVGSDGRRFDFFGGGLFRMRPDGTELEPFSTGVRNIMDVVLDAEDNAFTYDNTDEHEWMGRLTHMVDGGFYGYPYDFIPQRPYTLWCLADLGAGAATAMAAALDDALPPDHRGNLFLADFGKRNVLRVPIVPSGGTFAVRGTNGPIRGVAGMADVQPLFTEVPEDFRPVGLAFSPEGRSLWIGDWQFRDVKDTNAVVGRLWKLTWTGGGEPTPLPAWYVPAASGGTNSAVTSEQLLAGLRHPSKEVRLCAQRRLMERMESAPDLATHLRSMAANRDEPPFARVHALWALAGSPGHSGSDSAELVTALIADPDAVVAGQAIRRAGEERIGAAGPALVQALGQAEPMLRFRAATALGRLASPAAIPVLQGLLADDDSWVRFAVFTALNRIGRAHPDAWPVIVRGLADANPPVAEGTSFALQTTWDEPLATALRVFREDRREPAAARERATTLLAAMCRQPPAWDGGWWAYHPFRTPAPAQTVEWPGTAAIRADLLKALGDPMAGVRKAAVAGLTEETSPDVLNALRERLKAEADPTVRAVVVSALGLRRDTESAAVLAEILTRNDAAPAEVAAALEAAGSIGGPALSQAVVNWLAEARPEQNPVLWSKAVAAAAQLRSTAAVPILARAAGGVGPPAEAAALALGRIGGVEARQELLRLLTDSPVATRRQVLRALADLPGDPAIPELLAAWSEPDLRPEALLALARQPDPRALEAYLDGLTSKNLEQRTASRKALESLGATIRPTLEARATQFPPELLAELQRVFETDPEALKGPLFAVRSAALGPEDFLEFALTNTGDPVRGERLFRDPAGLNCLGCHRLRGEGADVGPDLSNMGAQFGVRELAESILWPSKVVREGYQAVLVELKDGEEIAGLIKGDTADFLTLRDSAGRLQQVAKGDVANRRQSDQSLMPEGLEAGLTLQEFADLVAFASRCRDAP